MMNHHWWWWIRCSVYCLKIIMKSDLTDDQIGSRLINNLPTLFTKPLFQDKKRWRPNFPNYVQSQSRGPVWRVCLCLCPPYLHFAGIRNFPNTYHEEKDSAWMLEFLTHCFQIGFSLEPFGPIQISNIKSNYFYDFISFLQMSH